MTPPRDALELSADDVLELADHCNSFLPSRGLTLFVRMLEERSAMSKVVEAAREWRGVYRMPRNAMNFDAEVAWKNSELAHAVDALTANAGKEGK